MTDTSPTPADQLRAAAQRALESLDSLIADHQDPGAEALGARYELARELSNTSPEVARQLLGTTMLSELTDDLTAEEAQDQAADLATQLYRAQDALAFVGECCDIADRAQRPVTTGDVREWLKGARCGRQLLGTTVAESAGGDLEPQDHPGADLFVALRAAGLDVDEANRRMHAYAGMVLRQEKAITAPPAPADRAAVLREAAEAVDNTEFPDEYVDLFDNGARWASRLLRRLADEAPVSAPLAARLGALAGVQPPTTCEAHPPSSSWLVEWRKEGGDWVVAYPTHDHGKALNRLSRGRKEAPDWQWRLVRETTTYTVEPEPAAPAAPEETQ
ncbi:hypothetical protein [Streptomyces sp. NPDC057552]|uniref:hypothetical protein n=1 Tax=Streptomyces sp. NPDC057552 TaxID=3350537 RepID=UPI0036C5C407